MKELIPVIRKMAPGLIASDIVGVQPMMAPAAQIFTMRTRYDYRPLRQGDDYDQFEDYMYWVSPSSNISITDCVKWCTEVFGDILGDRWRMTENDTFIFRSAADRNWFIIRWGA